MHDFVDEAKLITLVETRQEKSSASSIDGVSSIS